MHSDPFKIFGTTFKRTHRVSFKNLNFFSFFCRGGGFETHGERYTKSKIGQSVAPQNGPCPTKNVFIIILVYIIYYIIILLYIYYYYLGWGRKTNTQVIILKLFGLKTQKYMKDECGEKRTNANHTYTENVGKDFKFEFKDRLINISEKRKSMFQDG